MLFGLIIGTSIASVACVAYILGIVHIYDVRADSDRITYDERMRQADLIEVRID